MSQKRDFSSVADSLIRDTFAVEKAMKQLDSDAKLFEKLSKMMTTEDEDDTEDEDTVKMAAGIKLLRSWCYSHPMARNSIADLIDSDDSTSFWAAVADMFANERALDCVFCDWLASNLNIFSDGWSDEDCDSIWERRMLVLRIVFSRFEATADICHLFGEYKKEECGKSEPLLDVGDGEDVRLNTILLCASLQQKVWYNAKEKVVRSKDNDDDEDDAEHEEEEEEEEEKDNVEQTTKKIKTN